MFNKGEQEYNEHQTDKLTLVNNAAPDYRFGKYANSMYVNYTKEQLLRICEDKDNEIQSLYNTINLNDGYKQKFLASENENYSLKRTINDLFGLRDALYKRIEELEMEVKNNGKEEQ